MGRAAARLVLDGPDGAAPTTLRVRPELVVRASTAPAPETAARPSARR
jgi:DNA-binding LacI/PurR family transcriptional regulator